MIVRKRSPDLKSVIFDDGVLDLLLKTRTK